MPRPAVRSALLDVGIRNAILRAFGTQLNGYWQLDRAGLLRNGNVTPSTFARALRGDTVSQEQAALILMAWDVRRVQPVTA